MFSHERFRELSAIAAIGHLSKEEERELDDHLRQCESCREVLGEYSSVVRHVLPEVKGADTAGSEGWNASPGAKRRQAFFSRVRNEGVILSDEAEAAVPESPPYDLQPPLRIVLRPFVEALGNGRAALSAAALVLIAASAVWFIRIQPAARGVSGAQSSQARDTAQTSGLHKEIAALQEQLANQEAQLRQSHETLAALQEARRRLSASNLAKDDSITALHQDNQRLSREKEDYLVMKQVVDAQISELTNELAEKKATLDRVSQLLTVTPDMLKVMGAQRLHIVDVHDFDENGTSVRAFGRIFYAEDQAFVFYAFDLPAAALTPERSTFQAWGQRDGKPDSIRKLGTFDFDRERRRWVLQVKDPSQLAGMDHVFVTDGRAGDLEDHRGRKLLNAYIGGDPNHP